MTPKIKTIIKNSDISGYIKMLNLKNTLKNTMQIKGKS